MAQDNDSNSGSNLPLQSSGLMPDDWGTPHTEEWFKKKATWILSNYNHWIPRFVGTNWDTSRNPTTDRWATNIGKWVSYYKQSQDNITLGHFARDVHNNPIDIPIINGTTIFQICRHHEGKLYKTYVENLDRNIGVADRSADTLDERMMVLELAKLGVDLEFAKDYEQIGVDFQPVAGQRFDSYEQAIRYMEESPMEQVERIFTGVAKDFLWSNGWRETFQKIITNIVVTYYNRVKIYAEKGQVKIRVYRPDMCVWDNWADDGADQYGKKDRYGAVLEPYSITELFTKYDFNDKDKEDLQNLSKQYGSVQELPAWFATTNLTIGNSDRTWWNINQRIPSVMVAECYWRGLKADGKTQTVYRCDLIGNRYIKNFGEAANIIEDDNNPSDCENVFLDCRPEMFYGSNMGMPERLCNLSDEVDALEQKNRLFIARAMGKVLFVNRSKLDDNTTVREILTDAKTMGVVTYVGSDIDEVRDKYPGQEIIDVAELTVDGQGIVANRAEINEKKRQMELIASTPEAVMGQQTLQGSNSELQSTLVNASYGIVPMYEAFYLHINHIVQRAVDLAKLVQPQFNPKRVLQTGMGLSKRDFMYVELLKPYSLKQLHAYVDQRDGITDQERMRYFDIIFNYSQNPESGIKADDAFAILSMNSKREVINYTAAKVKIYEFRKEQARQQEMAMKQEQAGIQAQTQQNVAETNVEGTLEKEAIKTERDLMLQQMKNQQSPQG